METTNTSITITYDREVPQLNDVNIHLNLDAGFVAWNTTLTAKLSERALRVTEAIARRCPTLLRVERWRPELAPTQLSLPMP